MQYSAWHSLSEGIFGCNQSKTGRLGSAKLDVLLDCHRPANTPMLTVDVPPGLLLDSPESRLKLQDRDLVDSRRWCILGIH